MQSDGFGWMGIGMLLLLLMMGCSRQAEQQTVDLTVPVTVQPVDTGLIEAVVAATGTLRPVRQAQLVAEIRGTLTWRRLDGRRLGKGMPVEKNQIVATLENKEWVVGVRLSSKKLAEETALKTLHEQEVLFKRGLTTEKEVENARKAWQDARAGYEDGQIQIAKTKIRTPIAGVLADVADVTEGTLINQNTPLAKVVDYSEVLVDLKIPNAQIADVAIGQPLRVTNYAFPDRLFEGEITEIDPVLDAVTRTFHAVGTVDNADLLLRPGMFVRADIVTDARNDVVLVSRNLVQRRRNQKVVFVEEEGRAQQREIETGLEDQEHVEIISGLDAGERLITSNYETLRPRTRVRITGQGN